jgi:GT2 family glycosyltransferase
MAERQNFSVSVLVINWNAGGALLAALKAIKAACIEAQQYCTRNSLSLTYRILVWDNASSDCSIDRLNDVKDIRLTKHRTNIGFAAANNKLAAMSEFEDWLWLVNPDTETDRMALVELLKATIDYPEFSSYGSILRNGKCPEKLDGLGDIVHLSGLAWRDGFDQVNADVDSWRPYECFAVCGAALFIRKQDFDALGGFDEDFFCYQEDIDLGWRLRLIGHRALQVPTSIVLHHGSLTTGGHQSDFSIYHGRRNMTWCYVKCMPLSLMVFTLPFHLLLTLVDLIYFSLVGKPAIIWRAKWDALLRLPNFLRKRKTIQLHKKVRVIDIWRALDKRILPWNFKRIRAASGRRFIQDKH